MFNPASLWYFVVWQPEQSKEGTTKISGKDFAYLFLEIVEGRKTEREGNVDRLPLTHHHPGTWPTTQACALTGNRTGDLLVCRPALNPLSHTSQGKDIGYYN